MKNASTTQIISDCGTDLRRYLAIVLELFRHQLEVMLHEPLQVMVHLFEPALVVGTFMLFRYAVSPFLAAPIGTSLLFFYVTGFYPKYLFIFVSAIKARGEIAAPHMRFPVAQRLDYIIVHVIITVIEYIIIGLIVFDGLYIFGMTDAIPSNLSAILLSLTCATMLGFGWGMINLVLSRLIWFWSYASVILNRILILFAGAHFVVDFVSPNARYLLSFNPEVHTIALFRTAFYQHYPTTVLDVGYMIQCSVAAVLLGLILERVSRRAENQ
jgi:capsular polysaccharide transport system permease protein